MADLVNHPPHYTAHASGVECIELTERLSFCLGNAVKYLWRAGLKGTTSAHEDRLKAAWYLRREATRLLPDYPAIVPTTTTCRLAGQVLDAEESETALTALLRLLVDDHGWFPAVELVTLADQIEREGAWMAFFYDLPAYRLARVEMRLSRSAALLRALRAGRCGRLRAEARADLDAAGELPPSWLENSPRPESCLTTTPGSPTVA